ncbi:MAG: nucleotidyltransferase family protein [Betaproteobacteria bacterium]|nr:nucleotidyltransferase family protein [Betaproteobacteria bacterium]
MKAMILAAGRGERMRPLTDRVPKALLEVGGRPLIARVVSQLARCGYADLVINVSHGGELLERALGDGQAFGARIVYSREAAPLETAGGIAYALPLLGDAPFVVVNGDICCDYDFARLKAAGARLARSAAAAHLVLVDNPPHHPEGDFCLRDGLLSAGGEERLTFSGIGVYAPELFAAVNRGDRCPLIALIGPAMADGRVSGEQHHGLWIDVGTPQRLAEANRLLRPQAGDG